MSSLVRVSAKSRQSLYRNGEKVFLPDVEEISNILYGYTSDTFWGLETRKKTNPNPDPYSSSYYFLRSLPLTNSTELVGCVDHLGNITSQYKTAAYGICPAFNLKRSEVLFSSVAEDGDLFDKSLSLNAGSSEVTVSTGLTRKLTLLDKRKSVALASGRSVTAAEDGTVTVPYTYTDTSGTQREKVNQLSVMITDKPYSAKNTAHAQILYYGALKNIKDQDGNGGTVVSTKTGTGEFVLPTALQGKDYHIYLIAEHVSADVSTTTKADELKAAAKVTLEGTAAPNPCEMEVEWSIVDADGNPAVYNAASGAENRYKWLVKASEYTLYDVNGVSLTGTVR